MAQDFDDVLEKVGSYGRYQKLVTIGIIIPTSFVVAITLNVKIFQTLVPESYWCDVGGRALTNFTLDEWKDKTIPRTKDGTFDKCSSYDVIIYDNGNLEITSNITSCTKWKHDGREVEVSIPTDRSWLCDKELHATRLMSIASAGNAVGTFCFPLLADKFTGRRIMFFLVMVLYVGVSLLTLVVYSFHGLMVLFFMRGLSCQTNYQMPYVIGLELMTPDKRALTSFFSFAAWAIGMCCIAIIAWILPHWTYLTLITCAFCLPIIVLFWFLPESPRWLLAHGEVSKCADILLHVAKTNGIKNMTRAKLEKDLTMLKIETESSPKLRELVQYPKIIKNYFVLMLQAFVCFMVYVCISIDIKILPNSYYLSFLVLSLSELPSNVSGWLSAQYFGRRATAIITQILSVALCLAATFLHEDRVSLLIIIALMKVTVTQGLFIVYLMSSEIFPTPIRSTGMGMVVVSGMAGSTFSPYIVSIGGTVYYLLLTGLCVGGLLLSVFLPETLGLPLPQTFCEAERIGTNVPFFKWVHHWNKCKYVPVSQEKKERKKSIDQPE